MWRDAAVLGFSVDDWKGLGLFAGVLLVFPKGIAAPEVGETGDVIGCVEYVGARFAVGGGMPKAGGGTTG